MQNKLIIPNYICDEYLKSQLRKFIIDVFVSELLKNKHIISYISDNYDISFRELTATLSSKGIDVIIDNSATIFRLNSSVKIKDIKLESIISLINDGNLDIKGCKAFDIAINQADSWIPTLIFFHVKGDS